VSSSAPRPSSRDNYNNTVYTVVGLELKLGAESFTAQHSQTMYLWWPSVLLSVLNNIFLYCLTVGSAL